MKTCTQNTDGSLTYVDDSGKPDPIRPGLTQTNRITIPADQVRHHLNDPDIAATIRAMPNPAPHVADALAAGALQANPVAVAQVAVAAP